MKFENANCDLCKTLVFKEEDLIAYRISWVKAGKRTITIVKLNGEQPWSGVHVVCKTCVNILRQFAKAVEEVQNAHLEPRTDRLEPDRQRQPGRTDQQ